QRGLAGSRFADQNGDAGAARQPVLERAERLAMVRRQEEEPRVRGQLEGPFAQAVEGFVHQGTARQRPRVQITPATPAPSVNADAAIINIVLRRLRRRSLTDASSGIAATTGRTTILTISSSG